jgi:hypothetical protein
MADIQVKGQDGKTRQKKQRLRVDFTPMVDMNMLLITFFMFCTTLLKPQTMRLVMPAKDVVSNEDATQARASTAVTILLGANNEIFYYLGLVESYDDPAFLVATDYSEDGLRRLLIERNAGTYELIQNLKLQRRNLEITDEFFYEESARIQAEALRELRIAPTIIIKPTELASYRNMVDALDEMLITNIGSYAIVELEDGDRYLLYQRTGNTDYLTEGQRSQL